MLWLLPAAANPPGPVDLLEAFRLGQNPAVEVKKKLKKEKIKTIFVEGHQRAVRDPGGHDQAGPCLLSYGQSCDLCAHRNSLPRWRRKIFPPFIFFPQTASPMTSPSWPPSEHRALPPRGSSSPPTARMAASFSRSRSENDFCSVFENEQTGIVNFL